MARVFIAFLAITTNSQWISPSTPLLPTGRDRMTGGSYNQSIFLVGGTTYEAAPMQQVTSYCIDQNTFTTATISGLWKDETLSVASSQYYTSVNNILYIAQESFLTFYDMATNKFTKSYYYSYPGGTYSFFPCLASISNTIYVTGGLYSSPYLYSADVHSLDLSTRGWNANLPTLNIARSHHSCIVSSTNKLYVIAGYDATALSSIEVVSIDNIETNTFGFIGNLSTELTSTRAVEYQGIIFIVGGSQYGQPYSLMHIIDTSNDDVSISSEQLAYRVYLHAVVIVDNIIYSFGGYDPSNGRLDTWMYYEISSSNLTSSPTKEPIQSPTPSPTLQPISFTTSTSATATISYQFPSSYPTQSPVSLTTIVDNSQILCDDIIVEIMNLDGISSYDLKTNQEIQDFITNVTYYGIVRSAYNYGIGKDEFYMEYESVSDNMNITESICVQKENVLNVLDDVVMNEANEICKYIRNEIVNYFDKLQIDDVSTDHMNVTIYWGSYQTILHKSEGNNTNIMEVPTLYITVIILGLFLLFASIALLDAKCIRKNDYLLPMNIITVSFEVLDTILDILFAALLLFTFLIYQQIDVLIAAISSFVFIIIPISFSIIQLITTEKKSWFENDSVRGWLLDHSNKLFALSIITGSSYAAIEIVNCGAFGFEIFNMGLNKQQRITFNTKRIIGVICFENIPQTIIQIWYLSKFEVHLIPLLSIVFAIISIALALLTKYTQKSIMENSEMVKIKFDIKGEDITPKLSKQTKQIHERMAALFEVTGNLIDIPKPKVIHKGLRFKLYVFVNDAQIKYSQFDDIIKESMHDGELVNIFKNEWELNSLITVQNIECQHDTKIIECQEIYKQIKTNEI